MADSAGRARRIRVPSPLTVLLGREQELAGVTESLSQPDVRLITITGPAGVGKTRLAIEAAWRLAVGLDEIVFISFAALSDARQLLPAVARELGATDDPGRAPLEAIAARLTGNEALLVFDNLEHLPEAAAPIGELLAAAPGLRVLATTRSTLRIRGERLLALGCLPLPESDPADGLTANAAVALFVERAASVDPSFVHTPANDAAIVEICRRLEGLPLAIELAAARAALFSPEAVLARLDRRLALLTDGPRDLPGRQRTLRAAIAWSVDLLSPAQQRLFARLALFSGPITLRAAEFMADAADDEAVAQFSALVDENLLQRAAGEREEPRFIMLETLREYGLDLLDRASETEPARRRHAAYCLALATTATAHMNGGARASWLRRLDLERDNLRAALDWLISLGDAERALELAGALWQFWWWRSHLSEGRRQIEAALALPGAAAVSPQLLAMALTGAGALAETLGDDAHAERRYGEALAAWEEGGDERGRGLFLVFRWLLAFNAEDHDAMAELASESLALFRRLRDDWGAAMSLLELGLGAMRRQEPDAAAELLEEGLALFRADGDAWGAALCQGALGNVALQRGRLAEAARLMRASLDELLLLDDRWGVATILPAAAHLAMQRRDHERAVRNSAAAAELHQRLRSPLKPPFRRLFEGNLAAARALLGEEAFAAAWRVGQNASLAEIVATAIADEGEPSRAAAARILSPRELEVLRLAAKFRTDAQIADDLFISKRTVNRHMEHILAKLNAASRHEAVAAARTLGLI